MRIPGRSLMLRSLRWSRSRIVGGVPVLGYHRVRHSSEDPFDIGIPAEYFAAHVEVIARRGRAIPLAEAIRTLEARRVPSRAVVVTFDDGYADLIDTILPLLERYEIPATVFVTTGPAGRAFWWDELAAVLLSTRALPPSLDLVIQGTRRIWALEESSAGNARRERRRRHVLASVAAALRVLTAAERDVVMAELRRWSGTSPAPQPGERSLTALEIARLAAHPLIDIGAHTISHPTLTALRESEQRHEIAGSRATLQELTGRPVASFSYPDGAYSPATISMVRDAGFTAACCSVSDVVTRRSDVFALPRLWVQPRSGPRFERWLSAWLAA